MPALDESLRVDPEAMAAWPQPSAMAIPEAKRAGYLARRRALEAYELGEPVSSAARRFRVNRITLTRIVRLAPTPDPAGYAWGFRACLPYFRAGAEAQPSHAVTVPLAAAPHAFTKVLGACAAASRLAAQFDGPLPIGRARAPAFDRLFHRVTKAFSDAGMHYPLNTPDQGRRALLLYLRRQRQRASRGSMGETPPPTPAIQRLDQLFPSMPFMRVEYDGHREDVHWRIEVPKPGGGGWVTRAISCVFFLVMIESVSRAIVAWGLVLAKGYRQWDLRELFSRSMQRWSPQVLTTPDLCYASGAGMPSSVMPDAVAPRGVLIAGDNYRAHNAKATLGALLHTHLGVWNWSQPHVPEKRPIVEAFFHHIEQGALRHIAGGFIPPSRRGGKPVSTSLSPDPHPLNVLALRELMDVVVTAHNCSKRNGGDDPAPLTVLRDYVSRGGWVWQSSLSDAHARELSTLRFRVTMRGSRAESRQPYVEWKGARYRSDALCNRFDLCGKTFLAETPLDDLRVLTLLDPDGSTFVRLPALPPWSMTKHDLHLREQVIKWSHSRVLSIAGVDDAVRAYHHYVRENAHADTKVSELYAREQALLAAPPTATRPRKTKAPQVPREGWIGAERMEDLP